MGKRRLALTGRKHGRRPATPALTSAPTFVARASRDIQKEIDEKNVRRALEIYFNDGEDRLRKQAREYDDKAQVHALTALVEERRIRRGDISGESGESKERGTALEFLAKSEATILAIFELRRAHLDITTELIKTGLLSSEALDKFKTPAATFNEPLNLKRPWKR